MLAAVPLACEKSAVQFADYLRFLGFTGTRAVEALKVRWSDVDFTAQQVTIGTDGAAKNSEWRTVDLNPQLAALQDGLGTRTAEF